jgi:excisionase family DNA binding protein
MPSVSDIPVSSQDPRLLPTLLTIREVGEVLRIGPKTIERWVSEGRIHPVRLTARSLRYRREDVLALIDVGLPHGKRAGRGCEPAELHRVDLEHDDGPGDNRAVGKVGAGAAQSAD